MHTRDSITTPVYLHDDPRLRVRACAHRPRYRLLTLVLASLLFPGSSINWSGKISPRECTYRLYHPRANDELTNAFTSYLLATAGSSSICKFYANTSREECSQCVSLGFRDLVSPIEPTKIETVLLDSSRRRKK